MHEQRTMAYKLAVFGFHYSITTCNICNRICQVVPVCTLGDACFCLSNESYEVYVTVAAISSEWWGDGERSPQRCPWAEPLVRGAAV